MQGFISFSPDLLIFVNPDPDPDPCQSGQLPSHKPSSKLLTRLVAPHFTHGALIVSENEVRCNRCQFNTINCSNQQQATVVQ